MKCNQKLCQRTKNLSSEGVCNVCADVIKENEVKHSKIAKKAVKWVEVDINQLVAAHKKLEKGEQVDQDVLSKLLLGGIINILSQHDTIDKIEEKVKHLEHEKVTDQSRIEALENWVLKQNDKICELEQNIVRVDKNGVLEKENADIEDFKKRISSLEIDFRNARDKANVKVISPAETVRSTETVTKKSCKECNRNFFKTCDLEKHMVLEHAMEKKHKCAVCEKTFLLKWRLMKHMKVHSQPTKTCNYFSNDIECPFEELGCKFQHEHSKNDEKDSEHQKDVEEEIEENESIIEDNFCYFCKNDFDDPKSLENHTLSEHMDRFQNS